MTPKRASFVAVAVLGAVGLLGALPSALAASGPPGNTSPPTISGTAMQGQTLTASPGTWSRNPTSYAYQWRRCNATGGACASITGATAKTYLLTSADVGSTLRVAVTATNKGGSTTATSAATAVVQPPPTPPANTSSPTISGTAQDGQILTANPGTWTGTQPITYMYQWQRCDSSGANCNPIAGATTTTYTLTSADVGGTIAIAVKASNAGGSVTATSSPTAVIQPMPPAVTAAPTVSGLAQDGQTLTATTGTWTGTPPITFGYQWESCNPSGFACVPIAGATNSTYAITTVDVGTTISVLVTASNAAGNTGAFSAATAVVQPKPTPPTNTAPPTISGTAQDGQTLTASPGTWTGTQPITYTYQWQRCDSNGANCTAITGATSTTYTVTSADVGATIAVGVTASNTGGNVTVTSSATAVVLAVAPALTADPTVSGLAQDGQTLTATSGTWTGTTPITYGYQWESCDSSGANCNPIAGATASTYGVTTSDVGTTLRILVTATNAAGSTSDSSAATAVVQSATAPPTYTSPPTISGTAQVGQPLIASPGTWTGTQPITYTYQWQRCDSTGANCNPIAGATSTGYTATLGDAGSTLTVAVTANNPPGSMTVPSAPTAPVQSATSSTIFSDGFESGNFSAWSSVTTAGDGTATVQSAIVSTGSYAAQLSESANSGSKSYVRKTFSPVQDLTATGDFQLLQAGTSSGNVPFFRFLDPGGTRLVSLYRQNGTSNQIYVNYGGTAYLTTGRLALNTWATFSLHLTTNGAASTVAISLNGTQIYASTTASLGTTGMATLQIGNDTAAQVFGLVADNISVQGASVAMAPSNSSPPTIAGTAQQGQGLTAGAGTWTGTQPIGYAYQWQRCDSNGANCSPIAGATTTVYTLTAADVGYTLEMKVTASNTAGSAAASSAPTAVVASSSGPPPGLVALWHMDEPSGTTMFDSVGTHNGTLVSTQLGLPGFTGTAYGFNGSSYVDVPSTDDLNPGSANITFTIHLKTSGTPPPPPEDWDIFRKGLYTTGGAEWKMEFQQSGQASCGFEGTGGYAELVAGPAINDGQWHTISCIKTSTAIQVVVDGQAFSKAANVGSITNTTDVAIGARPGSDWYQGQLDEASVQIG